MALLDAIMEGLADADNAGVRDICGSGLKEFLLWSMKQDLIGHQKDKEKAKDHNNFNAIALLQRLFERLAQPEPYMR